MGRVSESCVVLSVLWRICVIIAAKRFLLISEAEKIYGAHALARVNDVRVNISKCVNYYTVNQPTLASHLEQNTKTSTLHRSLYPILRQSFVTLNIKGT